MTILTLAWRILLREWRAGEMRVLAAALLITVGALSAVGLFTDRINQTLRTQASVFLGADLSLRADYELDSSWQAAATKLNLESTRIITFPSMVLFGDEAKLVEVKAVEQGYPLRGELRISSQLFSQDQATSAIPQPGTVWIDPRLASALNIPIGSALQLGEAHLVVASILTAEPDRSGEMFNVAPRLLMNRADTDKTGLLQAQSRAGYRILLRGENIAEYAAWARPKLQRGERLLTAADARPEMRVALARAEQFLGLAAVASVILSAVAMAVAARRFIARHLDDCAIMACVGATQGDILKIFIFLFLMLAILGSLLGSALGYAAQGVLAYQLKNALSLPLNAPSLLPLGQSIASGIFLILSFALPPLLRLRNVPALRILRRELKSTAPISNFGYVAGIVGLAALVLWQAGDLQLGLYVLMALLVVGVFAAGSAFMLLRALKWLPKTTGISWRYGVAALTRRASSTITQIVAFAIGMMILLTLTMVRNDLIQEWQKSLPVEAPNRFLINVQPNQVEPLKNFLLREVGSVSQIYPMVKARLTAINGKERRPEQYQNDRARRLFEREFNLSSAAHLPRENTLIEGAWWDVPSTSGQLSVEKDIAILLGIKMGDELTYQVAGENFSAKVTSIRKVEWASFQPNFFVLASPGLLDPYPKSYITSFYLPSGKEALLTRLTKTFPNFTVIDVAAIMTQVRTVMDRSVQAIQFVFLFTLIAGLIIMYAAVVAGYDERVHEAAILRTLGAGSKHLLQSQFIEFAIIGIIAAVIASLAASSLAFFVSSQILHLPYHFNPEMWIAALVVGGLGIASAGLLGTRGVVKRPPLEVLQRAVE